jgi:hypothetical protein
MAKYFIDLEFLEGTQNKTFLGINVGKTKPTIDLISIGIVSEEQCDTKYDCGGKDNPCRVCSNYNSRSYYAISKDFNLKEAWNRFDLKYNKGMGDANNLPPTKVYWLRENVLKPIYKELREKELSYLYSDVDSFETYYTDKRYYKELKRLINKYGKTNKQIAEEIKVFIANRGDNKTYKDVLENEYLRNKPEFYAYYADYDWVAFCWLFGKMIDLPKGFPMYCKDLKQSFDERDIKYQEEVKLFLEKQKGEDYIPQTYNLKNEHGYPKQTNEHNALFDAKFAKDLYYFLKKGE